MDDETRVNQLHREGRPERGSSLIEVLVALLIMLFLMIGVLQLFSMSYLLNLGSAARTEMSAKAEQVVENIRYIQAVTKQNSGTLPTPIASTGITFPLTPGTVQTGKLDPTTDTYWGPDMANVFPNTAANDTPYEISYDIRDTLSANGNTYYLITISVLPTTHSGARPYIGAGISHKRVDYVAQIPQ